MDPLSEFADNLAGKIKLAKEHQHIMQAVRAAPAHEDVTNKLDPFTNLLTTISNAIAAKLPVKQATSEVDDSKAQHAAVVLAETIKHALVQTNTPQIPKQIPDTTDLDTATALVSGGSLELVQLDAVAPPDDVAPPTIDSTKALAQKIKDAIEEAKKKALTNPTTASDNKKLLPDKNNVPQDRKIAGYIEELEKIKDTGTAEQQEEVGSTLSELKEYIDKTVKEVKDYSRRILDLGGGGGSVAVQYAHGGTMNGNLNVNGSYLSGGTNLMDIFVTSESDSQTLAYTDSNYNLSISNGNTVSLSSINATLSAEILPTVTNYLSTNNVLLSAVTITQNLSVGGTIFTTVTANAIATYRANVGNASGTSFNLPHNLNTRDLVVSVYDNATNVQSYPTVTVVDANTVNIQFSFAPANNAYACIIIAATSTNRIAAYGGLTTTAVEKYQFRSANFNAAASAYYAVDTSSGPVRCLLPASPSLGDTLIFIDTYKTWASGNLVLQRNGNTIETLSEDLSANLSGFTFKITWVGAPAGWRVY